MRHAFRLLGKKSAITWFMVAVPGLASMATAAPVLNIKILGWDATQGQTVSNAASSIANVASGDTINYEAVAYLSGSGTANTNLGAHTPIGTQVSGDGVNSLDVDLSDSSGQTLTAPTMNSNFNQNLGWSAGTASGHTVTNIVPFAASGTYFGYDNASAADIATLFTGSFTAGSAPSDTLGLVGDYAGTNVGAIKAYAGTKSWVTQMTNTSENSSDPLSSYTPLTLTEQTTSTPEPASMALFGIGGLLAFRRRARRA